MAAQNQPRPSRLLSVVAVVLIGMYAAVALGTTHAPKLGLDLRGGTAVILKAVPPPGTSVTKGALSKAVSIIRQRVDTLGVSESQVTTQGSDTISVEVPGKNRDKVVALVGTTAQLRFRQVLQIATGSVAPAASPTPSPTSGPSAHPTAKASVKPATSAKPSASTTRHRPLSAALLASGAASP